MKNNNLILGLLFVGVLMGALDISIVGPAIPSIHKALGLDEHQVSWIFSIYILFSLMGISLFARLSDRYGRRPFYILAVLIFGFGSLIAAMAHNIEVLLIGRAIQGFGASGIFPVASATVGDIFPQEKRGRALGLIGMVFGLAFLTGPVIAGLMLKFFSWNSLFLINIPFVVVVILGSIKLLPAKRNSDSKIIDWPGIISLGLFLSGITIALNNLKTSGFWETILSLSFYPYIAVGLLAFLVFILIERRSKHPVVDINLFNLKQVRIVGFLAFGTGLYQAAFVFVPAMTVKLFGVEPSTASFMLLPVVFTMAISSPVSGRLIDKYGSRIIINIAFILMAIGLSLLFAVNLTKYIFYFAGIMLGMGLSVLAGSSLRYIMLNEVSAGERASAQGVLTIMISLGQIIASALIGAFTTGYQNGIKGYQIVFALLTFITVFLGISSLRLKSRKQEKESYSGK
jgi:EmrB/QacA subfamily drug resistance transporter